AVTDDDKCGEAEPAATLDDLGDTVDRDDTLDVVARLRIVTATVAAASTPLVALAGALVTRAPLAGALVVLTACAATLRSSHHAFLCSLSTVGLTGSAPSRGRHRRPLQPARGRHCRHGRTQRR